MTIKEAFYPLVAPPAPPPVVGADTADADTSTYGRDTYCVDALRPGHLATGKQVLAQRLYHRLVTPRGTLRGEDDEANFGIDLEGLVGSTDPRVADGMLPTLIRNELQKDPEVESVTVEATSSTGAGLVRWSISVQVVSAEGPFELVLAVSSVTVDLLGVR